MTHAFYGLVIPCALFVALTVGVPVAYQRGYAAAQAEAAEAKVRHDAAMAKLGLCEWPKAFYAETHCDPTSAQTTPLKRPVRGMERLL